MQHKVAGGASCVNPSQGFLDRVRWLVGGPVLGHGDGGDLGGAGDAEYKHAGRHEG
jgi:hypothetical protein